MASMNTDALQVTTQSNRTLEIAEWIASVRSEDIGPAARAWAADTILDWFAVTVPGSREPLSEILSETVLEEGAGPALLVGRNASVSAINAAMTNGAASHALDYDDVNSKMMGHPSVPVVPALLALANTRAVSGQAFLEAFIVGYETEVLVAQSVGMYHYDTGWHMTATIGTLGAAAAASRILGLSAEQTAHALGLAVAQAAGLKSMFGTMSKPFQVGKAAANGLLAARLAAKGMTSRTDAIECSQGLADTQSDGLYPVSFVNGGNETYAVENNLFKYHAACYLTHSSIECARHLREAEGVVPGDVERITIEVNKAALRVCNIAIPETGLQIKFSLRHTVAMALTGIDTSDLSSYTDEMATNPALRDLAAKAIVVGVECESRSPGRVRVERKDGSSVEKRTDVGVPAADQTEQRRRLKEKFRALVTPILGAEHSDQLAEAVLDLDTLADAGMLAKLSQPT